MALDRDKVFIYNVTLEARDDAIKMRWGGNIGFGEYTLRLRDDRWYGDSESMDRNDDKWFIWKLLQRLVDELDVEE